MSNSPKHRLNYFELRVADSGRSRDFYSAALGWQFTDFGPTYAATTTDDTDLGLDAETKGPPLAVIESNDLEASLAQVEAAGGTIVKPIFDFPGGRRFHFTDPDSIEVAIWQRD
ncbi:VOC family protein [Altererythrobacter salegens]|uniref:VOC family protein n=1 Tax=Croceibacterium salegens TaxID=1737568 RepID=A0A6I4ST54_9SPHN|nr:VOC family protein [Croceibacterium salegens]MXO59191.1 VOC family protein [Croceibacterium salegens]